MDGKLSYSMIPVEPMDITVWMFNPNIEAISENLQNLHDYLKDYASFTNKTDWMN